MDWFRDAKRVGMTAIPIGAVGGFLLVVALTSSATWLLIVGVLLMVISGAMWTLHGISEDQ